MRKQDASITDKEYRLREMTEDFLLTLISGVSGSPIDASKTSSPFQELGIDSFHVLQVVKKLETHFGTLSKTLLFENFTVRDLANYFVRNHEMKLAGILRVEAPGLSPAPAAPVRVAPEEPARNPKSGAGTAGPSAPDAGPVLILETDALVHPNLGPLVSGLFEAHKNEGSVSRGTRSIAPNLFISSTRKGFFNYARSGDILLAYAYTGPDEAFPEIARELIQHCAAKKLEPNFFTDNRIEAIGEIPFTATPFGAVQRILDLRQFTLQGGKMRRLRYLVSKFQEAGACRTEEYRCGTDKETDRNIAAIIDRWCDGKTMVNPLIHVVKQEILDGRLTGNHRIFLTYLGGVLQNAILISPMSREAKSYLMDLEFYPKEMPLGGLEYAIAGMIEILVAEGCRMLSLGATFGVKIAPSENADPRIESILDRLREQNLFNDEGNLQFKNKFRTENRSIFLCRPAAGSNPDNVTDIILMIADPGRTQISDAENHTQNHTPIREEPAAVSAPVRPAAREAKPEGIPGKPGDPAEPGGTDGESFVLEGKPRSAILADAGFNTQNIPASLVEFDLRTDSWSQLESTFVRKQVRYLRDHARQASDAYTALKQVFPFKHLALAQSGRAAERAFYQAWKRKGEIPENLLFPTTIFHQIDGGFTPKEMPLARLFAPEQAGLHRGGLDLDQLRGRLQKDPASVAMACVELSDNGAGGYPVSLGHLREMRALLDKHSIPLVIDATRLLENALCEEGVAGAWEKAREILSTAHVVIASLTKDFRVARGGLIATDDASLHADIEAIITREGLGLDPMEKRYIALALRDARQLESKVARRMENVRLIWNALDAAGVPLLKPAGTHCVVVDVDRMEEFRQSPLPVASFLAWLYLATGIRAGALSTGMKKTAETAALARLAIPVGLPQNEAREIASRLVSAFGMKTNIPVLAADSENPATLGDIHARYALRHYGAATVAVVPRSRLGSPAAEAAAEIPAAGKPLPPPSIPDEIAVIGMAGRYPKAANLGELWENLLGRKDCIEELPQARLDQRQAGAKRYRGGFLADIDRFDSLFFNISPREAEIMDPQERLFLETAWEALEDAGYFPEALAKDEEGRKVGVFVGAVWTLYQVLSAEYNRSAPEAVQANSFLWSIANRVSYWMNFTGPSLTLDTACSSSLTALHLACEALKRGECTTALVGGVNLDLHQHKFDINRAGGALSEDGVCRSFGKGANGYVAGEGVGVILLKPLQDAMRDRDNIHGIIKGIAVNHGGKTGGYTVPSPNAQADLIGAALRKARVDARDIGYVEAHGTGTELGDPIEISGLNKAFEAYGAAPRTCAIGSIKTNIGHLEAAAGIAGVCKALLQMKHRTLVPSLHSRELNEHIDFGNSPFYVEQEVEDFPAKEVDAIRHPRRSGVSSFGAGGANAHVILEEFISPCVEDSEAILEKPAIFPLSARSESQLAGMAGRLRDFLRKNPAASSGIRDIAHTLQVGRKSFDFRLAILARSRQELADKLDLFLAGKADRQILAGRISPKDGIVKLLNREEKEEFIRLVSRNGDPNKVAQIWVEGLVHSWQPREADKCRRISLPTYPFADERHWIRRAPGQPSHALAQATAIHPLLGEESRAAVSDASAPAAEPAEIREILFTEAWEELLPEPRPAWPAPVILFVDEVFHAGSHESESFPQAARVLPGEGFRRVSDREFLARPGSAPDLALVLSSAFEGSSRPVSILYAWSKGKGRQGILDLFNLFRVLRETKRPVNELILAGRYNQDDSAACWDYSWIGFERSLAMHFPSMPISILLSDEDVSLAEQAKEVFGRGGVYWYRGGKGHGLISRNLDKVQRDAAPRLKQNGAYLITGGAGSLGYHFAKHLAENYGARILLAGRRGISPELERKLADLRAAGAREAHYLPLDLGSDETVREFAGRIPFPLSGVFHAAGVESPKLFHEKSEQDIEAVLAPKTTGTLLLDEALQGHPLDFISYFSSSAAVLGDGGACDYAVGNRFLMAHAEYRNRQADKRGKTAVINWPLWKDGGMGIPDPDKRAFYLKSSGQALLEKDEGLRIWHDLLASDIPQALLLKGDAKRLAKSVSRFYEPKQTLLLATKPSVPAIAGKGWQPRFEGCSPRDCILWDVKSLVHAQLRIPVEKLDLDTVLTDYGFESIGLAEFAQKLSGHFGVQVTPDVFFTYTTLAQLADYFEENHKETITGFYRKPEGGPSVARVDVSSVTTPSHIATHRKPAFRKAGRADDRIAIVGMAGRFPGARDVNELWALLAEGRNSIREIPADRWDWRDYFKEPGHPGNLMTTNQGAFLDGIDEFDAPFFGFGREEADWTDPGQRLLLMEAYHAIEDAGIRPASLRGKKIGVYVGMEESQYGLLANGLSNEHLLATNGAAMISSRLSYCLDLRGPAISVNTACSSGLAALHQAAMAIRNGDCEAALVGAIALLLTPATLIAMSATGMLSPDGRCHSLGNRDDGMGLGEAVAVLMLKPLAAAQADGDNIHGILRASGLNFDGKTNGITAPNGRAQSDLLETVYRANGIPIGSLDILATHTTGTKLGDSIELNALGRAMRNLAGDSGARQAGESCVLTCGKGNLGHTLAASGLVSVIGLLKGMGYRAIPASLNCETGNDYVAWKDMPFRINRATVPWKTKAGRPRLAAASSFGRSGTNAHVVVEEYGMAREALGSSGPCLIPLSAKTPKALEEKIRDLARFVRGLNVLEGAPGSEAATAIGLAEIAHTLQTGRDHLEERAAVAADSLADLLAKLEGYGAGAPGWHRANAKEHRQNLSLLTEDASIQETVVGKWIQDRNFAKLLDAWTKGLEIDWARAHEGPRPRKISLPGYPFARDRHWIDPVGQPAVPQFGNGQVNRTSGEGEAPPTPKVEKPAPRYLFLEEGETATLPVMALDVQGKADFFVRQTLADQLKIDFDRIDLDTELADMGITSKDMVEITLHIKLLIDPSFVPTAFFDCTTTRSFAHALAVKNPARLQALRVCRSGGAGKIGTDAMAAMATQEAKSANGKTVTEAGPATPLHVRDAMAWEGISIPTDLPRDFADPRAVLLTGATGYLGIHLLAELLHERKDMRVFCLVRAEDPGQGMERISAKARTYRLQLDMDRMTVLCGDITRPNLGLSGAEWDRVSGEVQQIVHSSAHVNHIEGYAPFRPSTQGMREVIRLACSGRLKLIHFISSIAACTFFDGKQVSIHEKEEFIEDGHAVFGGYGQSKWVQETMLRKAGAQGLPFVIYRFGELGGSSRTGLAQTADMVHRLLQMRLSLGVREKISSDVLDMLPVDFAARLVARACGTEKARNRILHATHPRPCPMPGFYSFAEKLGYSFRPVARAEYLSRCLDYIRYTASFNPVDAFILECVVMREVIGLARNMRAMDGYFVILFPFDQANFLDCLEAVGLELPPWEDFLGILFRNWSGTDKDYFERIQGFSKWQEAQEEEMCEPVKGAVS